MIGIYKITSPSGRIYAGQSSNIEKRWQTYNQLKCKAQINLYRSFLKYGINSHLFEVIEECALSDLNEKERAWQDYYDVINKGLNCKLVQTSTKKQVISEESKKKMSITRTGQKRGPQTEEHIQKRIKSYKGVPLSEEMKKKLSESHKGLKYPPCSEEHKKKISEANKGRPSWIAGTHRSEDTKQKIGDANRGKQRTPEQKLQMSEARKGKKRGPRKKHSSN